MVDIFKFLVRDDKLLVISKNQTFCEHNVCQIFLQIVEGEGRTMYNGADFFMMEPQRKKRERRKLTPTVRTTTFSKEPAKKR